VAGSANQVVYKDGSNAAAGSSSFTFDGTVVSTPVLSISPAVGSTNEIRFLELVANGVNYVGFKAANSLAANVVWTLPSADGSSGQLLATNASGVLSWTSTIMFATNAANIIGGSAGQIPYITWEGSTGFTARGIKGQSLTSNGTAQPTWSSAPPAASSIFLANNFGGL
jgi:hypothetical protein